MRNLSLGVLAVAAVSVSVGLAQAAGPDSSPHFARHIAPHATAADGSAYYIVRLKDAPAATYAGGVPGYAATSARLRGMTVLDVKGAASYAAYLDERQSALLDSGTRLLGRALQARFHYHYALDGMSLKLTPAEAQRLAALPGVLSVQPVQYFAPTVAMPAAAGDTNASRAWVNAPVVWQLPSNGTDNEGEGVVVADLDTGVNHANSSFAPTGHLDGYSAQDPGSVRFGVCDPNNTSQHSLSTPLTCNAKLIGAYSYTHSTGNDPRSPEDSEGHGSHTASTIVGDFISVTVNGNATPLSGVAPHASLIAYDICDPTDLCGSDQSVAAVDQAIQDQATLKAKWGSAFKGMVLNYSIGGTDSPYADPVEQAFLSAEEAGIYVSVAGGNGGPANAIVNDPVNAPQYPVQHLGPWVATIAAATHDGTFSANLLENFAGGDVGTRPASPMSGVGDTGGLALTTLVYAGSGAFDGKDPVKTGNAPTSGSPYPATLGSAADAQQCLYPFGPGTFAAGEIVVCDRGTIPLVDKAYNVMKGGAGGVVIATTSSSSQDLVVEPYVIPGTLIGLSDGDALRAWISASGSTAMQADISGATLTTDTSQADQLAGFSSRGPSGSDFDSVVKPDLTAPGVSVLAAVENPAYADGCSTGCTNQPETFNFLDGTSMATPHDTGAAALLKQAHPSWTPSEIKSALMLTAVTMVNGTSPGLTDQCASLDSGNNCVASTSLPSPQVRGAGRIDLDAADRTGFVLDETGAHYAAADPAHGGKLSTLNLASLGDAVCAPSCSWTRTVKSAFASADVNYSVSVSGATSGLQVHVSPASFTLGHGQSQQLTVSADSGAVPVNHWAFAEIDIATSDTGDGGAAIPAMHMPVAVQAVVPAPHMSIATHGLDYTVAAGKSAADEFTIRNDGQKPLTWSLDANGGAGDGSFSCSSHGMSGLSFSSSSGIVAVGSSATVTATFDAASLASGDYSGVICVSSNASDNPLQHIPVSAKITGGSGGGGGGDESLFGLAALLLAWRSRKVR